MALQEYKCPCCGGAIEFDSTLQKMKCPYCDTEFEMETLLAYDEVLQKDGEDSMTWEPETHEEWQENEQSGMRSYVCKSCGGEIIGTETLAATACPFCGNPVVMMGQFTGTLRPDYVIPFKLDREAAKRGLTNHLSGKKLLPRVFSDQNHIDEVQGFYVPFWLFDADAEADVRYKATKVRSWSDSRYNYTETSYYAIHRSGSLSFEHVPVDGATRMPDDLMESLEPFQFSDAVDFQTAYLAGYLADKYDVTEEQCAPRANERIKTSTVKTFNNTVKGYSTLTTENASVRLSSASAKYVLCPVWILHTTWNGQKYTFAMNGQTGKFVGNLPMDKGRYRKYLIGWTFGVSAAILLASLLLWVF